MGDETVTQRINKKESREESREEGDRPRSSNSRAGRAAGERFHASVGRRQRPQPREPDSRNRTYAGLFPRERRGAPRLGRNLANLDAEYPAVWRTPWRRIRSRSQSPTNPRSFRETSYSYGSTSSQPRS